MLTWEILRHLDSNGGQNTPYNVDMLLLYYKTFWFSITSIAEAMQA